MQHCGWGDGFRWVSDVEIQRLLDNIDHDRQQLLCIPLAKWLSPQHNPIYGFPPGAGEFQQLIYDVSLMNPPDCWGLVAVPPLDRGDIHHRRFWCAKVRWSEEDGQVKEGWINVAVQKIKRLRTYYMTPGADDWWLMYFKLAVISKCLCGTCEQSWLRRGWRCERNS